MKITTVSQLPDYMDPDEIRSGTYFGVQFPISEAEKKYTSQKITYSRIKEDMMDSVSSLYDITPSLRTDTEQKLSSILSGDGTNETNALVLRGTKNFKDRIFYSGSDITGNAHDDTIPNKKYVDTTIANSIQNQPAFIKSNSTVNAWLSPSNENEDNVFVTGNGDMYGWYLNQGKTTNEVTMGYSGNLVIYGYVSAPKNIQTSQCWMALEAEINGGWKMIQLQPLIIGQKANFFQYVGFNAPVAQGLKVRISTGFLPNLNSSGYANSGLVYALNSSNNDIQEMNAFYGYIIH